MNTAGKFVVCFTCLMIAGCGTLSDLSNSRSRQSLLADSTQSDTTVTSVISDRDSQGRPTELLSAFYGLEALPKRSSYTICEGAGGKNGMPLIFSQEIDVTTMQAGDFRVTRQAGDIGEVTCITLAPADDTGELRTGLLVGLYGSAENPPVRVDVIGNLLSIDGSTNFKGSSIDVTPLESGPAMVWAELVPESEWALGKRATTLPFGGGSGCPAGTKQVIRTTWAGGVTKPGGEEIDDVERQQYIVTLQHENGRNKEASVVEVIPFALGDLGDGDNNHELCLDVTGNPQSVFFPSGYMTDPRDDLNPATKIEIQLGGMSN